MSVLKKASQDYEIGQPSLTKHRALHQRLFVLPSSEATTIASPIPVHDRFVAALLILMTIFSLQLVKATLILRF
jgi:hypothetical protein